MVCPWWFGYVIDNPLRRLFHNPLRLIGPYVQPGMMVLDVGCGMGLFTIPMARIVGGAGRVIAVDVQQRMLDGMMRRAQKAGIAPRIFPYCCAPDDLGRHPSADFALAFFCIHETGDALRTLRQIRANMKPDARFYLAEPSIEVPPAAFERTLAAAQKAGFAVTDRPSIRMGRAAVFAAAE